LPRRPFASLGEVFRKEGFATSQTEEKARLLFAINQELADTLSRLEGVIDARVHVALPDRDPLGGTTRQASASVVVIHRPGEPIQDHEIDIKAIVMDGVEGLDDINRVTVKFFQGPPSPVIDPADRRQAGFGATGLRQTALLAVIVLALGAAAWASRSRWPTRGRRSPDAG
jgi:type III secretion protein J